LQSERSIASSKRLVVELDKLNASKGVRPAIHHGRHRVQPGSRGLTAKVDIARGFNFRRGYVTRPHLCSDGARVLGCICTTISPQLVVHGGRCQTSWQMCSRTWPSARQASAAGSPASLAYLLFTIPVAGAMPVTMQLQL
jgi:hypothetical protein